MTNSPCGETIAEAVRERYTAAALQARYGSRSCCGSTDDVITSNLYEASQVDGLPEGAVLASLGCGNPTALIDLQDGQTVLDLGSGGGIDALLSAKRVGPDGFVYGLDMTEEMLALAMENKARAGVGNVAFLKGRIEDIPLPAGSVDVVISNCVINLAADKSLVLEEAFRVLRPGGRFAVSDVVSEGPIPAEFREDMESWVGCVAGALEIDEYEQLLRNAGFDSIAVEVTRRYRVADLSIETETRPSGWQAFDGKLASAFVRATKPPAATAHPMVETATTTVRMRGGSSSAAAVDERASFPNRAEKEHFVTEPQSD